MSTRSTAPGVSVELRRAQFADAERAARWAKVWQILLGGTEQKRGPACTAAQPQAGSQQAAATIR